MSGFQVGDLCEIIHMDNPLLMHLLGRDCTIVSIGINCSWVCECDCQVTIAGEGDTVYCGNFRHLRKKRPPGERESLGDWDLCPWRPAKEKVS